VARAVDGVLLDLLMAVMDSPAAWTEAAGDAQRGMAWRDEVTDRMVDAGRYRAYESLVAEAAAQLGLGADAPERLVDAWQRMEPRPDGAALRALGRPYAFVTNASRRLAETAAARSGLAPRFTLSAEESGWYKPQPVMYVAACRRLGCEPARTLFVAGAGYDAEGAHGAGLQAALVLRRPLDRPLHGDIRVVTSLERAIAPAR
jgi:2-haloalkanoic acid dehalogenase type II